MSAFIKVMLLDALKAALVAFASVIIRFLASRYNDDDIYQNN